jgi:hypothetical protein
MSERLIAIQIGAVSFVDEGTEQVLDILQEQAGVTCLFLANFTYTRGTGERQVPGFPLPDHGAQEYDLDFVGGNYGMGHAPYYRRTFIGPDDFRAREHGDLDTWTARKYAEMRLANLAACGRALADLDRRGSGPPGE